MSKKKVNKKKTKTQQQNIWYSQCITGLYRDTFIAFYNNTLYIFTLGCVCWSAGLKCNYRFDPRSAPVKEEWF